MMMFNAKTDQPKFLDIMNSVYFPAQVVLLLRRIVNVISTLSISNQYLLLKQASADEQRVNTRVADSPSLKHPQVKLGDVGVRWPWWWSYRRDWEWPRLMLQDKWPVKQYQETTTRAHKTLHWVGMHWSWFSSTSGQMDAQTQVSTPQLDFQDEAPRQSPPREPPIELDPIPLDIIHQLIQNPALYDPLRTPRYPIVLCHGLYGFDSRGPLKFPSMRMHYWSNVLNILRNTVRAEVMVTSVPGTGSIISRSERLDQQLQHNARGRGINLLAHSMGGLDCRHLISHLKPEDYTPLSLTTISTPHRGSPFMDWCAENIGIGKLRQVEEDLAKYKNIDTSEPSPRATPHPEPTKSKFGLKPDAPFSLSLSSLPSSFTTLILSIVDSPAYANLTSTYLNDVFNPATPNDPFVKYYSVASRLGSVNIWHPFWLPKMVLDGAEEKKRAGLRAAWEEENGDGVSAKSNGKSVPLWAQGWEWGNDGLVTVQSAKWGEFLGILEGCDHWEMRGARGIEFGVDLPAIPAIGLGVSTAGHRNPSGGDGWRLGRVVSGWRKEENPNSNRTPDERARERAEDDAVVKSSTDKLSAVLDWVSEQVPTPSTGQVLTDVKAKTTQALAEIRGEVTDGQKHHQEVKAKRKRKVENELATKRDLERFYVALSRKLYDEGL